jgi:hypothetical protein
VALDDGAQRALLDEALKKGALIWIYLGGSPRYEGRGHARWHAWSAGQVWLLTGPGEQPDPGLVAGGEVRVVVRSKDSRQHLLTFDATVSALAPGDEDWSAATAELVRTRLNLADADGAPTRWAEPEFRLYRLTPQLPLVEPPMDAKEPSRRAAPVPTPATTATRPPRVFHRRGGPGLPLS